MKTKPGVGAVARWGLLTAAVVMGIALVATSWASYRSAERASETLARGQGEAILQSARDLLRRLDGPPAGEDLEELLEQQAAVGLRYVALVEPRGGVVAEAGERLGELPAGDDFLDLGGRVRMRSRLPGLQGPPRGRPPRQGPPRGPDPPRGDPAVVIEFEPLVAEELAQSAVRSLRWSAVAALALGLATALFWRLLRQREVADSRRQQERQLRALGEMSAVLAHEIRNPVTSLKGHAQLLAERLPGDRREHGQAERIVSEAKRLEALSADLLDFCRSGPLDRQLVDPAALLRKAASAVDASVFEIDCEDAPRSWSLDPLKIRQVLVNVLRNARKASPAGTPAEARIAAEVGELIFVVRDFGAGLPPGDEERIFEPFYTTGTQGTGLGLGVARRIVEMHDGTITADNPAGGGARFEIRIPAPA